MSNHPEDGKSSTGLLALGALGIVYGDIGTSPLYALKECFHGAHAIAATPDNVYAHAWRPGDLLLWDNRCSSHARTDFPADQRRLMLRTTIQGTVKPY